MTFYRLLKSNWGKKFIDKEGGPVPNPDFIQEIPGPATLEGIFDSEFVDQKNLEGYNAYWFPNHPSTDVFTYQKKYHLSGRDIDVFDFVFVDMDLKDKVYASKEAFYEKLSEFPIKPNFTLDSGNGVHAYWNVVDLSRETYVIFQKRLIQHFKTDESIWTVLQLMRVPGSTNTKVFDNFKETQIIENLSSNETCTLEELDAALPPITEQNLKKAELHLDKLDGKISVELSEGINTDELPEKFLELLHQDEKIFQLFTNPEKTYGDKSGADASLVNLLFTKNLNRKEATAVIANSKKALSKGASRLEYAINTVDFVYSDRALSSFKTVGEKLRSGREVIRGAPVNGPEIFDCLVNRWRKSQVLGMIAGSGVGKTTVALKCIKDMIQNNPDNDDVYIFFSLEMPEYEIEERWCNLVGRESTLANRLYVIGNEDEKGDPRDITLQDIYWFTKDIEKDTGRAVGSIIIDHIGLINPMIDLNHKPTFGAEGDLAGGYGMHRALSLPNLCKAMKPLAKMLNSFVIVLTQTTKAKGAGDVLPEKDAAFGSASYEWNMDYVLTLAQPLMRIYRDTSLRVLAWKYAKIRAKHKDDPVISDDPMLLNYDQSTGELTQLSASDYQEFQRLLPLANDARKNMEKKEVNSYSRGPNLVDLRKLRLI